MGRLIIPAVFIVFQSIALAQAPSKQIYENKVIPFIEKYCIDCHDEDTAKGDFILDKLSPRIIAKNAFQWSHILDQLNLGEMPPKKKKQPETKEASEVISWITRSLKHYQDTATSTGGEVVLRRLNRNEYFNTVRDLLKIDFLDFDPTAQFDKDDAFEGFDNVGQALKTSPNSLKTYMASAETLLDIAIHPEKQPKKKTHVSPGNRMWNILESFRGKNYVDFRSWRSEYKFKKVEHNGIYQITIKAQGIKNKDSRLRISNNSAKKHLIVYTGDNETNCYFEDGKTKTVKFKVRLKKGQSPVMRYINAPPLVQVLQYSSKNQAGYKGSAIRIFEAKVTGPIHSEWPPPSHKAIFGDVKELTDNHVKELLRRFACRAFRRPVTYSDVDRYFKLYLSEKSKGLSSIESLKISLKVILSSPNFLYLYENPGKLNDFAIANRLSYFLWSSMPDDELVSLAAAKKLRDPKVLTEQFKRMLADPKSEAFIDNFGGQWLGYRRVGEVNPDEGFFRDYYKGNLEEAIKEESRLFFSEIVRENLPVMEVVNADWTFLNERLAQHYRIPDIKGAHFRKIKLKPEYMRGGILGHASLLTVTSNGTTTSPVVRGIWIVENILGSPPPPAPPDVDPIEPDIRGAKTIQQQLKKHREVETCNSCHKKIDPYGIALENYDPIGRFRTKYSRRGAKVNSVGKLADGTAFTGSHTLKNILSKQADKVAHCVTEKLMIYALGRKLEFLDEKTIQEIVQSTKSRGFRIQDLMLEVIKSEAFVTK